MRVVLDPNVVVSALLLPGSTPDRVLQAALRGELTPVMAPPVLDEIREVARRPKFENLDSVAVELVLEALSSTEPSHEAKDVPRVTRDPDDDYLVALALANQVDVLVSGDRDLLEADIKGLRVRSPRQFVDEHLAG